MENYVGTTDVRREPPQPPRPTRRPSHLCCKCRQRIARLDARLFHRAARLNLFRLRCCGGRGGGGGGRSGGRCRSFLGPLAALRLIVILVVVVVAHGYLGVRGQRSLACIA